MFRVVVYDTNECTTIYKSLLFNTLEEAQIQQSLVVVPIWTDSSNEIDGQDLEFSIIEVSQVTYASLIHSLSEYNENICPVYTLNNMTVDECFEYGIDLQEESWNDYARIEVYEQVILELKELKEIFDKNTKHVKCYLTDLL